MCIKLAYLRSLLKSAVGKFCFGKSINRESIEKDYYFKNELVEKKENEDKLGDSMNGKQDTMDDSARQIIEDIAVRAELASEYKVSSFELWKSAQRFKKFSDAPLKSQVTYCCYSVSYTQFLKRDFGKYSDVTELSDEDNAYCLAVAFDWMLIRRMVTFKLLTYSNKIKKAGLDMAASIFEEMNDNNMDSDMFREIAKSACSMVKDKDCGDETLDIEDFIRDCSMGNVEAIIEQVVARSEIDVTYTALALQLWTDLSSAKSFRSKDIRAQASACVYAVAFRHFTDRDFDQYVTAPQPHLRECRQVAYDWLSIEAAIKRMENQPEIEKCALEYGVSILDSQVNYRGDGISTIVSVALYLAYKKNNDNVKIEDFVMYDSQKLEEIKKILQKYIQ